MNNIFNKISGATKKSLRFLFFVIFFGTVVNAQTISNLDLFYSIIDTACSKLVNDIGSSKQVKLNLELGTYYAVFGNRIRGNLLNNGITLISESTNNNKETSVDFIIDDCNVEYSQPERDGLFGDYFTERAVKISGSYFISSIQNVNKFVITEKDSVNVSDVEKLENPSYPFTHGNLPPESFFSNLWEPVVAVSAAAITIILFFSVRSK